MNVVTALAVTYLTISKPLGNRGFRKFMAVMNNAMPKASGRLKTIRWKDGASFSYPAGDAYWQYYFLTNTSYEKEIAHTHELLKDRISLFLDCGANYGYWSCRFSRSVKAVAIEASSENLSILLRNSRQNSPEFAVIHAAITDTGGKQVWFDTRAVHVGRNITTEENENKEAVTTITIDELMSTHQDRAGCALIKLDVEGVEVEALKGARNTLKGDAVFIYEDHSRDRECLPTAYLLNEGKRIYYIEESGAIIPILTIEDALKIKTKTIGFGYNFIALGDTAPSLS